VDPTELRAILAAWPAPFRQGALVDRLRGFSGAFVYRLNVAGAEFALRQWPREGIPLARLHGLHAFLRFAFERGIGQLSVPVPTTRRQTVHRHVGLLWQIEPWMPGRADFHANPSNERLREAMQTLARLHLAAETFTADESHAAWFQPRREAPSPTLTERTARLEQWLPRTGDSLERLIDALEIGDGVKAALRAIGSALAAHGPVVREELHGLRPNRYRLAPCLRDVWHDHVLFEGDRVTGLIDPSACRAENPVIDLSRLLVSFDVPEQTRFALDAYEQVRPLTWDEHLLRRAFDRSQIVLAGTTWLERFLEGTVETGRIDRIAARLEEIVRNLRRL
jgi:Ser/Thr protein kinase RdoA (MazF antagonist)